MKIFCSLVILVMFYGCKSTEVVTVESTSVDTFYVKETVLVKDTLLSIPGSQTEIIWENDCPEDSFVYEDNKIKVEVITGRDIITAECKEKEWKFMYEELLREHSRIKSKTVPNPINTELKKEVSRLKSNNDRLQTKLDKRQFFIWWFSGSIVLILGAGFFSLIKFKLIKL